MTKLLTVKEVAPVLGLTEKHLYKMVKDRKIPSVRITGNTIRFNQTDLEKWIEKRTVKQTA